MLVIASEIGLNQLKLVIQKSLSICRLCVSNIIEHKGNM